MNYLSGIIRENTIVLSRMGKSFEVVNRGWARRPFVFQIPANAGIYQDKETREVTAAVANSILDAALNDEGVTIND